MKNLVLALIAGSLLFFTSCLRTDAPKHYKNIEGVVLDNGQPVANADIHIRNHFAPGGFVEGDTDKVEIQFETNLPNFFTAKLYRFRASNPFATFFEDSLQPGQHTIRIPDSLLSNGLFAYTIETSRRESFSGLLVINRPDSTLPGTVPFTKTNAEGKFVLGSVFLGFGDAFESQEMGEFEITDSLEIIATVADSIFATRKVEIKSNTNHFFEISRD